MEMLNFIVKEDLMEKIKSVEDFKKFLKENNGMKYIQIGKSHDGSGL